MQQNSPLVTETYKPKRGSLLAYAALFSVYLLSSNALNAQTSAHPGDSVFTYLGFKSGMSPGEVFARVRRRDGGPVDMSWCRPTIMGRTPTQLACTLIPVWLAECRLPVTVSFGLADSTASADYMEVTLAVPDSTLAAEELERVAALWELSGRKVLRSAGSGPYGQPCGQMAWIDDRDFRAHATIGCGTYGGIPGEPPRFHVDFYYP